MHDTAEPIMKAIEELWTVSGSDTVDLLMSRAEQFANEAEIDLSLVHSRCGVDIAPQEAEVWYLRAKANLVKGKPERALADLRRALSLDPNQYRAINDLGLVLEQLGAKKEALEAYRRALEVNPFLDDAREGARRSSARSKAKISSSRAPNHLRLLLVVRRRRRRWRCGAGWSRLACRVGRRPR